MTKHIVSQEVADKIVAAVRKGATVAQITGTSPETLEQLYALAHNLYGSQSFAIRRDCARARRAVRAVRAKCP